MEPIPVSNVPLATVQEVTPLDENVPAKPSTGRAIPPPPTVEDATDDSEHEDASTGQVILFPTLDDTKDKSEHADSSTRQVILSPAVEEKSDGAAISRDPVAEAPSTKVILEKHPIKKRASFHDDIVINRSRANEERDYYYTRENRRPVSYYNDPRHSSEEPVPFYSGRRSYHSYVGDRDIRYKHNSPRPAYTPLPPVSYPPYSPVPYLPEPYESDRVTRYGSSRSFYEDQGPFYSGRRS
jgi:hypothetical protein